MGRLHRSGMTLAATAVVFVAAPAWAGEGLVARAAEWLWPQVQARITVQTAALAPVSLARGPESSASPRGLQAGSLLGDYIIARPSFGQFRATSGVVLGSPGGAPRWSLAAGPKVGVTLLDGGSLAAAGSEAPSAQPYVGFGYSSPALWGQLSVVADVGWVAGRPAAAVGLGRAFLGSQGMDSALRDLRLAPLLQLGVRITF